VQFPPGSGNLIDDMLPDGTRIYTASVSKSVNPELSVGAVFKRSYHEPSGTFTFNVAFLEDVPGIIPNLPTQLIPGRGTPTTTFMNLMAMNEANIGFAGAGPGAAPLNRVVLSGMINVQTTVNLQWLRSIYGNQIPASSLRHVFSVQYAESAINAAGYRITDVRINWGPPGLAGSYTLRDLAKRFRPARGQTVDTYFSRYYGPDWRRIQDTARVAESMDIEISVAPRTQ